MADLICRGIRSRPQRVHVTVGIREGPQRVGASRVEPGTSTILPNTIPYSNTDTHATRKQERALSFLSGTITHAKTPSTINGEKSWLEF